MYSSTCILFATTGTPAYLSPEICQNHPYSDKSDIWAMACVLFNMLALVPAFVEDNFLALVTKITR